MPVSPRPSLRRQVGLAAVGLAAVGLTAGLLLQVLPQRTAAEPILGSVICGQREQTIPAEQGR